MTNAASSAGRTLEQLELADDTIALHCAAFSLVFEQLIELAAKRSGSVYKLRIHPA